MEESPLFGFRKQVESAVEVGGSIFQFPGKHLGLLVSQGKCIWLLLGCIHIGMPDHIDDNWPGALVFLQSKCDFSMGEHLLY